MAFRAAHDHGHGGVTCTQADMIRGVLVAGTAGRVTDGLKREPMAGAAVGLTTAGQHGGRFGARNEADGGTGFAFT